jgi:DNA-binding MarR family transcriptional regulator
VVLKRLEAQGYIARRRDERDERQVRVSLTAQGAALRAKAGEIRRCILEATRLSPAAVERLTTEIAAVRESLREAGRDG